MTNLDEHEKREGLELDPEEIADLEPTELLADGVRGGKCNAAGKPEATTLPSGTVN